MPPNVAGLPPEFIRRFEEALMPVCETRDDRRLLLVRAFGTGSKPQTVRFINVELVAPLFAADCCHKLGTEPVVKGLHPLAAILQVVGDWRGAEAVRDLDALIEFCNGLRPAPEAPHLPTHRSVLEREYLERLRLEDLINTDKYTRLAGNTRTRSSAAPGIQSVVARPEFEHFAQRSSGTELGQPRRFEDAVPELLAIRRAAVVGEPGAGKTTVLWKIARELVDAAVNDRGKPIPLLVRLGEWTEPGLPLRAFIASQLGGLGIHLDTLLADRKAALLLDGLNEIPVAQRKKKVPEVAAFLRATPQRELIAIVTCREQDYVGQDLRLDRVTILPLDPHRVLEFAQAYLGKEAGEAFFWRMFGGLKLKRVWELWRSLGVTFGSIFPDRVPLGYAHLILPDTAEDDDRDLRYHIREGGGTLRRKASGMFMFLRNPYMLSVFLQISILDKVLPANRARLFERLVEVLLLREHLASQDRDSGAISLTELGAEVLDGLARLAYAMQRGAVAKGTESDTIERESAVTAFAKSEARRFLSEPQLDAAVNASFIIVGESVRFTNQMLQEYFAARQLLTEIKSRQLRAEDLWPPAHWWERTGWEETAVLMTGITPDGSSSVLRWLADANPEVAAQCAKNSGVTITDSLMKELRDRWLPRLTDLKHDPKPRARAAVGRALGLLTLSSGETLDNRPGVGVVVFANRNRVPTPQIDWVSIDGGRFIYQDDSLEIAAFRIARYPVTYAQFQAFVESSDGWSDKRWWKDFNWTKSDATQPSAQRFKYWNHPRENVCWYEAMAYCRWLSARLTLDIALPTEYQWERAARGRNGREFAYEGKYSTAKSNTSDSIGLTSAVGIYPNGATPIPEGVVDLTGNVQEWCLDIVEEPTYVEVIGSTERAHRGGTWDSRWGNGRAIHRNWSSPRERSELIGFRVVCAAAKHQ